VLGNFTPIRWVTDRGARRIPTGRGFQDGDFAGLCKDMAALGVGSLELCSPGYAEFASLADGKQTRKIWKITGSTVRAPTSCWDELRTRQQQVIAWAKDIGMTQMGTASLDGTGARTGIATMDAVKKAADGV